MNFYIIFIALSVCTGYTVSASTLRDRDDFGWRDSDTKLQTPLTDSNNKSPKVIVCPAANAVRPCLCRSTGWLEVICPGPNTTQEAINHFIAETRLTNSLEPDDWLTLIAFFMWETEMTHLDLTPFYHVNVTYMEFTNNSKLASIGDPLNDSYIGSIDAKSFWVSDAALTDQGIGRSLLHFVPETMNHLALDRNYIQGSENEFITGLFTFTQMTYLTLYGNNITKLSNGQFRELINLNGLNLGENQAMEIGEDAFLFNDPPEELLNDAVDLYFINASLSDTTIHSQFSGLFTFKRPFVLRLEYNLFEYLSAENFEPILQANEKNAIYVRENDLICDNRMKWLKNGKDLYQRRVDSAYCSNDPEKTVFTTDLIS